MVSDPDGVQLSVAITSPVRLGKAIWLPPFVDSVRSAGQVVIVGACASTTVTVKLQAGPAVVVQFTVVVPTGKNDPEDGEQITVPQPAPKDGA